MLDRDDFKGHRSSPVNGVYVAAGRTEPGVTAEGDIFHVATVGTGIHGTAKGRIATMNHFSTFSITESRGC